MIARIIGTVLTVLIAIVLFKIVFTLGLIFVLIAFGIAIGYYIRNNFYKDS